MTQRCNNTSGLMVNVTVFPTLKHLQVFCVLQVVGVHVLVKAVTVKIYSKFSLNTQKGLGCSPVMGPINGMQGQEDSAVLFFVIKSTCGHRIAEQSVMHFLKQYIHRNYHYLSTK